MSSPIERLKRSLEPGENCPSLAKRGEVKRDSGQPSLAAEPMKVRR